ncbi:MAG: hypothetical protein AAF960_10695 [Bacteroidota bacterium]
MRFLLLVLLTCFISCQTSISTPPSGWQKVYKNDADGTALFGQKSDLLDAVRLGYPIRIGWGGNRVEHVADADFLTIFDGEEVFAQIRPIIGQSPSIKNDSMKIAFRKTNNWVKMAGSNGFTTALMTDYFQDTIVGGRDRYVPTTWYVNYPTNPPPIEARPLWREEAPNWEKWQQKLPQ